MPILGAALRTELTNALGMRSLRKELRRMSRELERIKLLVTERSASSGSGPGGSAAALIPAARVRALRDELGESRKAFAERLGVSSSIVFLWESGRSTPTRPAIVGRLRALMTAVPRRAAAGAFPLNGAPARPRAPLSRERRAALKLQGQYMGHLRNLASKHKSEVKALRTSKGLKAAIALARRLAKE